MTEWPQSLALVGAGKMGGAMLKGWLDGGLAPSGVVLVDPSPAPEIAALAAARGNRPQSSRREPNGAPEVLVLAVKPQMLDAAAPQLAPLAGAQTLVLSIIAGKTIANLAALAGGRAFVRAMPNTPAAVGRGITGAAANEAVNPRQRAMTKRFCRPSASSNGCPTKS